MAANQASTSNGITEDEAALYDRQIRLWGVEAQNRMRSASVLVVTLRGIATEVCKNIVLAGIGKLTVLDDQDIKEEDLGSGFFFREEEVGQKRVHAARERINALNPRVEVIAATNMQDLRDEEALQAYDLVVLTDSHRITIEKTNELCRKLGKKFYSCGSYGLSGYIFADLLDHEWIIEKSEKPKGKGPAEASTEPIKVTIRNAQSFAPFSRAVQQSWKSLSAKRQKKINPVLWGTLVLWEYQRANGGALPHDAAASSDLQRLAVEVLPRHGVDGSLLDKEALESLASTAAAEFMPVCAIIGGVMGQDVLNTLGGREPPVTNFFAYNGLSGAGDFYQLGIELQKP